MSPIYNHGWVFDEDPANDDSELDLSVLSADLTPEEVAAFDMAQWEKEIRESGPKR